MSYFPTLCTLEASKAGIFGVLVCAQIPSFWTKQKVSKIMKETKSAKTNWTFVHRSSMAEKANHEYCMCEKKKQKNEYYLGKTYVY